MKTERIHDQQTSTTRNVTGSLSSRIKMLWKLPIFQYHYKIMVIKVWDFAGGSLLKNKPANTGV